MTIESLCTLLEITIYLLFHHQLQVGACEEYSKTNMLFSFSLYPLTPQLHKIIITPTYN